METPELVEVNLEAECDRLAEIFRQYYPSVEEHPDWHHNFGHPLEVSSDMTNDIRLCEQNGVVFSKSQKLMLLCESFIHDIGIHWPLGSFSHYSSLEDRSRHIGPPILAHFGYDMESEARPAGELTMVTQLGSVCTVEDETETLFRKMARRTDMGNVGKAYEFFELKVLANYLEFLHKHPEKAGMTIEEFWRTIGRPVVVALTLEEDLAYGDWDREENEVCTFQNRCAENIERLDQKFLMAA